MSTDATTTEAKAEPIVPQQEKVATQTATEVDFESELAKKDAELAQIRKEKDNYRKAYLKKAGGKEPDEDDNSSNEDGDEMMRRIVREEMLATRESEIQSDKDALVAASVKKIKELTLALKNRGQVTSNSGQGSNEDKPEVKVETVLSDTQLAGLKAKGWSDKKIEAFKKNLLNPQLQK